jgi:hypothetical protein
MKNPQLLGGIKSNGWKIGCRLEPRLALVDVARGTRHRAGHEFPGARGLVMLVAMDQHMNREQRLDRRQCIAGTPPWGQAAAQAAGGTGEHNTSSHS